jgi:hypothetical protein
MVCDASATEGFGVQADAAVLLFKKKSRQQRDFFSF